MKLPMKFLHIHLYNESEMTRSYTFLTKDGSWERNWILTLSTKSDEKELEEQEMRDKIDMLLDIIAGTEDAS